MSAAFQPKHRQHPHRERARAAGSAAAASAAMSVPPPSGPSGRPEPALSRRQQPTQGKRNGITHIACRPCQRRKQKCDGRRPVCSPCRKKPSDCLYDAESDQRRTTALKARIQDLNKETEDLKDIVKGIATAPNRDAALAAARTLAATGFRQTANVADAFRKEQAAENEASKQQERTVAEPMACTPLWTGSASILYSPWSHGATTDAAIHNSPGRMSLEPWSLQAQAELLQFAQSGLDNDPAEPSSPFWKIEDQKNPSLQLVSQESGEIENTTRQPEYGNDPATDGVLQVLGMASSGPYWYSNPSGPQGAYPPPPVFGPRR